jgi:dTDP-4-amino-4,6-dideoxygalactose transaminase
LALWALGIKAGDEVITAANTCAPTIAAIRLCGAVPVFVDVAPDTLMMDPNLVEAAVTSHTRAVLAVHLWGMCTDMDCLLSLARKYNLRLVEDCAQAHGTEFQGRKVGLFGDVGCFSFYPTKNIGAFSDAGAVVTNDAELAGRIRSMRMYGYDSEGVSQEEGMNARLSEMQAAFLRVRLADYCEGGLERRLKMAGMYQELLKNSVVGLPVALEGCSPTWHQFVIRSSRRHELMQHLARRGITCGIHYATPVHRMPAYRFLQANHPARLPVTEKASGEILSLPIHDGMSESDIEYVAGAVNYFEPGM